MKNSFVILLLAVFIPFNSLSAQGLNAIRIESNAPIEVFINGEKACDIGYSCTIPDLPWGNYFIEVFAISSINGRNISKLIYKESVLYLGIGVKDIFVRAENINDGSYPPDYNLPMDDRTFAELLSAVNNASFDSDKKRLIEMAVAGSLFSTGQVRQLAELYTFDSEKLWLLKLMYPVVVDRDRAFLLQDVLSFSSSKEEFVKFAEDFDRRAIRR
ncbi:hypothetical protein HW49_00065 [Porphyromonadaceae bacterium COT-184 OH4590]|nr:hypothetical protein HW49_00065 [Porphyromonadaceae bacterium COT-184 OH4590]MDO4726876.1 DUF4476 domain-containing protein [Porphyromonadaceae bacterium]